MTDYSDPGILCAALQQIIDKVSFDDSGHMGKGGNGGLISRDTIRACDEGRLTLSRYREATK